MNRLANTVERVWSELPGPGLARWAAVFFCLFVVALQISIAVCQACLAVSAGLYVAHLFKNKPQVHFLPVKLPLAAFCLFSVLPVIWSENPTVGLFAVRKLDLFAIWLLGVNLVTSAVLLRWLLQALFVISSFTGLVAIRQFVVQYREGRAHHVADFYFYMTGTRIHGFMGHWMNFGGQQMLVFAFLVGFLLLDRTGNSKFKIQNLRSDNRISSFKSRVSAFWWLVLAVIVVSIGLNFTRSVWLGCFLATVYLVVRWRARWLWAMPVLIVLGYLVAPPFIRTRFWYAVHPSHEPTLSIRLEMWQVALKMIHAHPWVGVGPNNIVEVYDLYLPPGKTPEVGYHNHFHNDYLQFAAERGLPCLAAWLWLMAALGWHTWKARPRLAMQRWVADAAFATWLALLAEGCFEFNFGTSPVLMAFLFLTAAPFAAEQAEHKGRGAPASAATARKA